MIIATTLFIYQVDCNKLYLSHPSPDDITGTLQTFVDLVLCVFVFILLLILFRYIHI